MRSTIESLQSEFALVPVMAAEIECYVLLPDMEAATLDGFWGPVNDELKERGVSLIRIEKERGDQQYELVTHVTTPERLAEWLAAIKETIERHAQEKNLRATFAAKPFEDQPSSGLHLHLHLSDSEGINAMHKTEEWTSDVLRWSLGGLLADMARALPVFCPGEYSKYRFDDADHVPRINGWGVNNRYCALRIPANEDPYDKRIEHRVPGADANAEAAITAMLEGVLRGIRERIEPPAQEYGKPKSSFWESVTASGEPLS